MPGSGATVGRPDRDGGKGRAPPDEPTARGVPRCGATRDAIRDQFDRRPLQRLPSRRPPWTPKAKSV